MATVKLKYYGVDLYLDDSETRTIVSMTNVTNSGNATVVAAIANALITMGIGGSASVLAAIVCALFHVSSNALAACNSRQRGVIVSVLWVGIPWCKSQ